MADLFVVLIIVLAVALAIRHIVKQRKNGSQCLGCSSASVCSGKCDRDNKKDKSERIG